MTYYKQHSPQSSISLGPTEVGVISSLVQHVFAHNVARWWHDALKITMKN